MREFLEQCEEYTVCVLDLVAAGTSVESAGEDVRAAATNRLAAIRENADRFVSWAEAAEQVRAATESDSGPDNPETAAAEAAVELLLTTDDDGTCLARRIDELARPDIVMASIIGGPGWNEQKRQLAPTR